MKYLICLFFLYAFTLYGQENSQDLTEIIFYGKDSFRLEGTIISDSLKENRYDRLPASYKGIVREAVWNLSKSSSGLSIRFLTNSPIIRVKWEVLHDFKMNHMPETGIKGVDLYFKNIGSWQYLSTGRPQGMENEYTLVENMTIEEREFKIYLPLYDGIKNIEIGIEAGSVIRQPDIDDDKPIVFYGTSITQGGCASRPGMAHTNIISRKLDVNVLNFGFSGNGRMEEPIAQLISEADAELYVIECMHNMISPENITERTIPLVDIIREKNPHTPILLVDQSKATFSALNTQVMEESNGMNHALKVEYQKMIDKGYKDLYYVETLHALGSDQEGTVDGVHYNDLGFMRYADFLIGKFREWSLIKQDD
ncbi:MAG: SGNH/GDSL hydrolase family protein [Bacteroidota bacterium]